MVRPRRLIGGSPGCPDALARVILILVLALGSAVGARAQSGSSIAAAIEATYLYKFAPYVEWPAAAFASPTAPLVICIVGDDPFGDDLDRAIAGEHIGSHPLQLRRMPAPEPGGHCHILYAAGSPSEPVESILAAVQGEPVLTVTSARLGQSSAVVRFVLVDNRVRFTIDEAQASARGLAISSKLLSLSLTNRPRS